MPLRVTGPHHTATHMNLKRLSTGLVPASNQRNGHWRCRTLVLSLESRRPLGQFRVSRPIPCLAPRAKVGIVDIPAAFRSEMATGDVGRSSYLWNPGVLSVSSASVGRFHA